MWIESGFLVGSILMMEVGVECFYNLIDVSLVEVINMVSLVLVEFLNKVDFIGSIVVGKVVNFVVFDNSFIVCVIICVGK